MEEEWRETRTLTLSDDDHETAEDGGTLGADPPLMPRSVDRDAAQHSAST